MPDASHDDPIAVNNFTVLRIRGIGVPPWSCRGAKQSLNPITQAKQMKRTVNGTAKDTSFAGFRKYVISTSCADQNPPNFDGRWPGLIVFMDCIAELSYTPDEGDTRQRDAVPGSEYTVGAHNIYRPRLEIILLDLSINKDEYDHITDWTLVAEEV